MKANLHLHSLYSDGRMWPEEIAARARRFGLQMIALTDHDSMCGVPDFMAMCKRLGLKGIAGVEIDCIAPEINHIKRMTTTGIPISIGSPLAEEASFARGWGQPRAV